MELSDDEKNNTPPDEQFQRKRDKKQKKKKSKKVERIAETVNEFEKLSNSQLDQQISEHKAEIPQTPTESEKPDITYEAPTAPKQTIQYTAPEDEPIQGKFDHMRHSNLNTANNKLKDNILEQHERTMKTKKVMVKKGHSTENQSIEESIKEMGNAMEKALLDDIKKNKLGKPAIQRFQMLGRIEATLRKTDQWQEEFLHVQGCQRLSDWMKQLPDGTYPNQKIVLCILGCIDRLAITQEYIEECDIEGVIQIYKDGTPGPGYVECQKSAKNILNKWYRQKNAIQTSYDPDGRFDYGYKKLQKLLERERQESDEENDRHGIKRIIDPKATNPQSFMEFEFFKEKGGFIKRPEFDTQLRRRNVRQNVLNVKQRLNQTLNKFRKDRTNKLKQSSHGYHGRTDRIMEL